MEYGPAQQSKTQFSPQAVPHIRKRPQVSHPHPSEGRQNENHNNRKLAKIVDMDYSLV